MKISMQYMEAVATKLNHIIASLGLYDQKVSAIVDGDGCPCLSISHAGKVSQAYTAQAALRLIASEAMVEEIDPDSVQDFFREDSDALEILGKPTPGLFRNGNAFYLIDINKVKGGLPAWSQKIKTDEAKAAIDTFLADNISYQLYSQWPRVSDVVDPKLIEEFKEKWGFNPSMLLSDTAVSEVVRRFEEQYDHSATMDSVFYDIVKNIAEELSKRAIASGKVRM